MRTIRLNNLEETVAFGRRLGQQARPGDIITLEGALGAGKTTLTQFIGQGLEVPEEYYITSPTFSLLHEYPGRIPLFHMDLYRLAGSDEITELGFADYLYGEGVCVIEWPDRLEEMMPESRLQIELEFTSETVRTAELTGHGQFKERMANLQKLLTLHTSHLSHQ